MNDRSLELLAVSDLWALREKLNAVLTAKIIAEKQELERRLARLSVSKQKIKRRYPKVLPKYQNPERPDETWSGRGLLPRWLSGQLNAGRSVDDFRISMAV
jgi:DNA-binding protein H-NS